MPREPALAASEGSMPGANVRRWGVGEPQPAKLARFKCEPYKTVPSRTRKERTS